MTELPPQTAEAPLADGPLEPEDGAHALAERLRLAELKLRGIQEISSLLTSHTSIQNLFSEVIRRTLVLMNCERAAFFRLSREGDLLLPEQSNDPDAGRAPIAVGVGIVGATVADGREINIKDAWRDRRFDRAEDERLGRRTTSVLCVPIKDVAGQVVGALQVCNKRDGYFTPDDAAMLNAIASQTAIVRRNAELFMDLFERNLQNIDAQARLRARQVEIEVLLEVEHAAAVARTLDEALRGILSAVVARYPIGLAAVFIETPARNGLALQAAAGTLDLGLPAHLFLPEDAELSVAWRNGGPRLSGDALREALLASPLGPSLPAPDAIDDVWEFPLRRGDDPALGALLILNCPGPANPAPHHGMEQAHRIFSAVADRIALATTLARAIDEERKAERLAAIGTALSGVVHDLRTPLTVIAGYARSMEREGDATRRAEHRGIIKRQIESIQGMIGEVLDFASGRSEVLLRRVFVRELIADIEAMLAPELAERGIALELHLTYKGAVRADAKKLMRVFANLFKNAREAIEGDTRDERPPPTISVEVDSDDTRVYVRVRDSGPGFPAALEGRLFESFATHGKGQGTGLGLAMARKIIEEHDGALEAANTPGGGAVVTLALNPA